jgi:hypothetical protein
MLPAGLGAAPALCRAGADQVALDIGQPAEYRQHQPPSAGAGVGPRFGQGSKLRFGVHDALDDAEQVEGVAGEASIRFTVTTSCCDGGPQPTGIVPISHSGHLKILGSAKEALSAVAVAADACTRFAARASPSQRLSYTRV